MKRKIFYLVMALSFVFISSSISLAEIPILKSIENQGVSCKIMDDSELSMACGAAVSVIVNQPYPSVLWGEKTYHVTWEHWGSQSDYHTYNLVGTGYNTNALYYNYNGTWYLVGGDAWLADTVSDPDTWNAAYAQCVEIHYQLLYSDHTPSIYAFHETVWNRPLTTFTW